ncbi:MAG TPA: hypothetical protein PKM65_12700 [Spirochaetota bacterium]|nr:hypothetical protein [Spirochaetota bacterium]HNT10922.1 hypothetical protein [Spirochaetota bacterium]
MMPMRRCAALLLIVVAMACCGSCAARRGDGAVDQKHTTPVRNDSDLVVLVHDEGIADPARDRRCYYRVFVNKVEAGRTGIGLESQRKEFRTVVDRNRHLVSIEKWVLDERKGRYEKLNNIEQPKPNFLYVTAGNDRIIVRFVVDHETRRAVVTAGRSE